MERESFVFYRSFLDAIEDIDDAATQLRALKAILIYGLNGEETKLPRGPASIVFKMAKPQLEANFKRAVNGAKGAAYGSKGGRPKTPKDIGDTEQNPIGVIDKNPIGDKKKTPNVNVNENANANANVNANANENGNEKVKETQPTPTPTSLDSDPEIPFRYGECQNVILTDMEHKRLIEKYGTRATDDYIERLSVYMDTTGKQYQGKHFSVIQQWMRKDNVPQITAPLSPSSDLYARALKIMEDHSACGAG